MEEPKLPTLSKDEIDSIVDSCRQNGLDSPHDMVRVAMQALTVKMAAALAPPSQQQTDAANTPPPTLLDALKNQHQYFIDRREWPAVRDGIELAIRTLENHATQFEPVPKAVLASLHEQNKYWGKLEIDRGFLTKGEVERWQQVKTTLGSAIGIAQRAVENLERDRAEKEAAMPVATNALFHSLNAQSSYWRGRVFSDGPTGHPEEARYFFDNIRAARDLFVKAHPDLPRVPLNLRHVLRQQNSFFAELDKGAKQEGRELSPEEAKAWNLCWSTLTMINLSMRKPEAQPVETAGNVDKSTVGAFQADAQVVDGDQPDSDEPSPPDAPRG